MAGLPAFQGTAVGDSSFRYRGFISYSHADARWAAWLQRQLERYRVPPRLAGRLHHGQPLPRKLGLFFRDRTELPSSSDLGGTLRQALADSQCLIVICSPAAARSRWVNEEVRQFRALGRDHAIYSLIVDGEPGDLSGHDCFPPALLRIGDEQVHELLAADARPSGDGRRNAVLKIAAALLGLGFDELRQRELQRRYRLLAAVSVAALAVAAVTAGLALDAYHARNEARERQQQAEDLINFMLGDLRDKLQPVGRLDVLDAVAQKAMGYFDTLDRAGTTDGAQAARARALVEIARIRSAQGNLTAGIAAANEAIKLQREQLRRQPGSVDNLFMLGDALSAAAELQMNAGQPQAARADYQAFGETMNQVLSLDRGSRAAREKLADSEDQLAMMDIGAADYTPALGHTEAAIAYLQALHTEAPQQRTVAVSLGQELAWKGYELYFLGRLKDARAANAQTVAYARTQLAAAPADMEWLYSLSRFLEHSGAMAEADGDFDAALHAWSEADQINQRLVAHDAQNMEWQAWLGAVQSRLGMLQLKRGELAQALQLDASSRAVLDSVFHRDPAQLNARTAYCNALLRSADFELLQRPRGGEARRQVEQALALWQGVEPDDIARQALLRAHLIQVELSGPRDAAAQAELKTARQLLDGIGADAQSHEVLELRARYAYLDGDLAAGDAYYGKLVASGDRQPFLARVRASLCRRLDVRQPACATPPAKFGVVAMATGR